MNADPSSDYKLQAVSSIVTHGVLVVRSRGGLLLGSALWENSDTTLFVLLRSLLDAFQAGIREYAIIFLFVFLLFAEMRNCRSPEVISELASMTYIGSIPSANDRAVLRVAVHEVLVCASPWVLKYVAPLLGDGSAYQV